MWCHTPAATLSFYVYQHQIVLVFSRSFYSSYSFRTSVFSLLVFPAFSYGPEAVH